jgi:hypothetical protein
MRVGIGSQGIVHKTGLGVSDHGSGLSKHLTLAKQ